MLTVMIGTCICGVLLPLSLWYKECGQPQQRSNFITLLPKVYAVHVIKQCTLSRGQRSPPSSPSEPGDDQGGGGGGSGSGWGHQEEDLQGRHRD